jgi:2-succinyl-5-enolpyruvyl-6-hydroxy-3-cyclohexene-1-carboxylate synthase
MPIRDIEWFARDVEPTVLANRGANGIDGVMSTAVGVAIASRAPVGVLVGDVAFLHDSNALLGLAKRSLDLRMVLVDNDGGGIFSFLPQAQFTNSDTFEALWGTPHGVDFAHLVAAHGLHYVECSTIAELQSALAQSGPIVIRVQTNRQQNVIDHDEIHAAVAASLRELLD